MVQSSRLDFSLELSGMMEVGRGEVLWVIRRIAVLPVLEVLLDDALEYRIVEEPFMQATQCRGEARDASREQDTAGP